MTSLPSPCPLRCTPAMNFLLMHDREKGKEKEEKKEKRTIHRHRHHRGLPLFNWRLNICWQRLEPSPHTRHDDLLYTVRATLIGCGLTSELSHPLVVFSFHRRSSSYWRLSHGVGRDCAKETKKAEGPMPCHPDSGEHGARPTHVYCFKLNFGGADL